MAAKIGYDRNHQKGGGAVKREKKKYLAWGLTAFLTGCALLIFYDVFYRDNSGTVQAIFAKLFSVLTPVLYGLGMAYLLAPIVNFLERAILRLRDKLERKRGRAIRIHKGWLRAASIFLTWAVVLVLVYLLLSMLVPQLVDSITTLVNNLESYYTTIYDWVTGLLSDNPELKDLFNRYYNETIQWLTTKLLPGLQTAVTNFTGSLVTGVWSVVIFTKNFLIGIIVSVYLLAAKEKSTARCCKLLYGVLPEEQAKFAMRGFRRMDHIFSGFVRGKLLDSLIIGILCFIGCSILKLPYTPLVSVVVGVTNVIPFFGPFLGAIPCALLILLVSPLKCLYFVIFIFLLQQLDGNVIGPKILGDSTGISSLWVIVAILVGGGFGGVLGMFLGVPIFACLQVLVRWLLNTRLEKRHMPLQAWEYVCRDRQDDPPPTDEDKNKQ
jgi:predicted PurR-regulated permease PerM